MTRLLTSNRTWRGGCSQLISVLIALCVTSAFVSSVRAQVLLGDQTIESSVDSNALNRAEAFQTTAGLSGTVGSLTVYTDTRSTATKVYLGLYADSNGHPSALLSQATSTSLALGAWNTIPISPVSVVANTRYWIAILGTTAGTPFFRDRASGSCKSEGSSQSTLTSLPATWSTGAVYSDCPISAYGSALPTSNPTLSVSPASMAFNTTVGGADPASITANTTNSGGGTLNFTATSDSTWLSVLPTSGTAPQSLQVSVSASGLAVGIYTGHVTITSPGSQGSPAVITASLSIAKPADWLMVDHDPSRSGNASDETIITPSNVGNLQLNWSVSVDGPVTGQPLFAGGVQISGQSRNVLIAATGGNSVYALDAGTGTQLWKRNFGSQTSNCAIPNGFGVTGAPLVDRSTGRVYSVSNDGKLRMLSLSDGTEVLTALTLISQPATNKVWGGLNKVGNNLYVATASDGCDTTPWRGQVYRIDVSAAPVVTGTFVVVPGIAAPNGGGGIWGYGGVSADPATGSVYAAAGDDSNMPTEGYTPFAGRMIALDGNLNMLGSYLPPEPNQFPCSGAPCDLDFGATPLLFQPDGCPTMVAAGNKNGQLYVFKVTDLAASGQPTQILALNAANDWLGSGGIGGVPAYWQAGNKVFISDVGPGVSGVAGGLVGLNVTAGCTLQVAWSTALGGATQPDSTPTVANGVVFVGEGATGMVHAYDAQSGAQLWNSGSTAYSAAATYAAPIVAQGRLYVGSWSNFTGGGQVGAFSLNSPTQILSASPTSLSFAAVQGGSNPASSTVNVTNAGAGTLTFNATSDSTWLTVSPASGSAPQNLQIGANVGGLAQGTYTGHITITSVGAQGSPALVTVTLTISPVVTTLSSLTLSPTTLIGGNSSTGAAMLSGPAPAGGASVTLSSSNAAAQVPANVPVLAGATTAAFIVTTSGVSGSTSATITGTYGTAQMATLNINPSTVASVTLNPTSVQGGTSSTGTVTLSGKAPAGGAAVALSSSNAAAQVPPSVTVTAGATTATFTVTTSAVLSSTSVTVTGMYGTSQNATLTVTPAVVQGTVLFGDQTIESQKDSNTLGKAEAFQTTATATGTFGSMLVYVDASSTATKIYLGLYADNNGHPGALLTQGNSVSLTAAAWNTISVSPANVSSGTKYWIAILGTTSGTPFFRDHGNGACKSEVSNQATLTALPATWSTGVVYTDCPISGYGR
jgi:outer membrane protein assembly factor BamB